MVWEYGGLLPVLGRLQDWHSGTVAKETFSGDCKRGPREFKLDDIINDDQPLNLNSESSSVVHRGEQKDRNTDRSSWQLHLVG